MRRSVVWLRFMAPWVALAAQAPDVPPDQHPGASRSEIERMLGPGESYVDLGDRTPEEWFRERATRKAIALRQSDENSPVPPDQHPGAPIGQEVQVIDLDHPAHRVVILISGKPYGVITIPDGSGGPQVPPPGPVPPTKPDPGGVEPGEPQPPQPPVGQPGEVDSPDDPALAPDLKRLRDVARVYAGATAYALRSVADNVRDGKITDRDTVMKELEARRKARGKPLADALASILTDATQGGTVKDKQKIWRVFHFVARTIEEAGK